MEPYAESLKKALIKISKMGAVCQHFELCTHEACRDSSGACLTAMDALSKDPDTKLSEDRFRLDPRKTIQNTKQEILNQEERAILNKFGSFMLSTYNLDLQDTINEFWNRT
jgi:hypothetical protein